MARYKNYCYEQGKMIPISFREQILPGTFEYTLSYLIDHELDLSVFDDRYSNDDTGRPAYGGRAKDGAPLKGTSAGTKNRWLLWKHRA